MSMPPGQMPSQKKESIWSILFKLFVLILLCGIFLFSGIIAVNSYQIANPPPYKLVITPTFPVPPQACPIPSKALPIPAQQLFTINEVGGRRHDVVGITYSISTSQAQASVPIQGDQLVVSFTITDTTNTLYPTCLISSFQWKGINPSLARFDDIGHRVATLSHQVSDTLILPLDAYPLYYDPGFLTGVPHGETVSLTFTIILQDANGVFYSYQVPTYTFIRA